jgi:hypothetical protein
MLHVKVVNEFFGSSRRVGRLAKPHLVVMNITFLGQPFRLEETQGKVCPLILCVLHLVGVEGPR